MNDLLKLNQHLQERLDRMGVQSNPVPFSTWYTPVFFYKKPDFDQGLSSNSDVTMKSILRISAYLGYCKIVSHKKTGMYIFDEFFCGFSGSGLSLSLDPRDPDLKFPDPGSEIRIQVPGSGH